MGGAESLKQSVAAGLGIGVISRLAAADQLTLGKLVVVPIAEMELRRPFYWLELVGRPASPAVKVIERKLFERTG
jgi:DNA-binding transcriptional LysR family regulator